MFDTKTSFFENSSYYSNYDRTLKKIKYHVSPKNTVYNLEISPITSTNTQYCTLQLKPTKLSNSILDFPQKKLRSKSRKKHKQQKKCEKKHGKKSKQSAQDDDSVLTGLQTVIDLCSHLEKGKDKSTSKKKAHKELYLPSKNQIENDVYESRRKVDDSNLQHIYQLRNETYRNTYIHHGNQIQKRVHPFNKHRKCSPEQTIGGSRRNNSVSSRSSSLSHECICFDEYDYPSTSKNYRKSRSSVKTPYHSLSPNSYHTYQSIVSLPCPMDESKKDEPCEEHCSEVVHPPPPAPPTPPHPLKQPRTSLRRRSPDDDIDEYWARRHSGQRMLQKSHKKVKRKPSKEKRKSSKASVKKSSSLVVVKSMTCTDKKCCVDGDTSIPCVRVKSDGKEVCIKSKCSKVLTAKCFPPVEIAPCDLSCDQCHVIGDVDPKIFAGADKECDCKHLSRSFSHKSVVFEHENACTAKKIPLEFKKSRLGYPHLQPIVGYCNNCKCGGDNIHATQYAVTKITHFTNFSVYEVMQPSSEVPKNIPSYLAEIFVLSRKPQKELSKSMSIQRPCSSENVGGSPSTRISFRDPLHAKVSEPNNQSAHKHGSLKTCSGHVASTMKHSTTVKQPEPKREPSCPDMPPSLLRFGTPSNPTVNKDGKRKK